MVSEHRKLRFLGAMPRMREIKSGIKQQLYLTGMSRSFPVRNNSVGAVAKKSLRFSVLTGAAMDGRLKKIQSH
jgi:hypothetical protein